MTVISHIHDLGIQAVATKYYCSDIPCELKPRYTNATSFDHRAKGVFTIERARLVKNKSNAINGLRGVLRLPPSMLSLERMIQSAAQVSEGKV